MATHPWQYIRNGLRQLVLFSLSAASLISIIVFLRSVTLETYPDFRVYYPAAAAYTQQKSPYDTDETFFTNFSYPPLIAQAFVPFTVFQIEAAERIWAYTNLALWSLSLIILLRVMQIRLISPQALWTVGAACLFFPAKFTIGMGQINMVLLFLLSLSLYLSLRGNHRISGILIGMSMLIKLFPFVLPILTLVSRRGRESLFYAAGCILTCAVVSIFAAPALWAFFLNTLLPALSVSLKSDYYNQTLFGLFLRHISPESAYVLWGICSGMIVITAIAVCLRYRPGLPAILALSLPLSLTIQTFAWQHLFVLTLISFAYIYRVSTALHTRVWWIFCFGSAYICCAINFASPSPLPLILQSHQLIGTLILTGLCVWSMIQRYEYRITPPDGNRNDRRDGDTLLDRKHSLHTA
jgi:hypothetical protein